MLYSERLMEMDDDRLQMIEADAVLAVEFHRRKGNYDTREKCEGILAEIRQEVKRRAEGGPPT
jgi:hypothetical protein